MGETTATTESAGLVQPMTDLRTQLDDACGGDRVTTKYPIGVLGVDHVWVRSLTAAERIALDKLEQAQIVAIMLTVCNAEGQLIYTAHYDERARKIHFDQAQHDKLEAMNGELYDAIRTAVNGHCCFQRTFAQLLEDAKKKLSETGCD